MDHFDFENKRITCDETLQDIKRLANHINKEFDKSKSQNNVSLYRINHIIIDTIIFTVDIHRYSLTAINYKMFKDEKYIFRFILNEDYDINSIKQNHCHFHCLNDDKIDILFAENNQDDQEKIKNLIDLNSNNYLLNKKNKYILTIKDDLNQDIDINKLIICKFIWKFYIINYNITINYNDNLTVLVENFSSSLEDCLEALFIVKQTYLIYGKTIISPEKYIIDTLETKLFSSDRNKECSVCLELTTEKTTCCHPICLKCRIKTLETKSKNRNRCPICRNKCLDNIEEKYFDNNDDEDDDEDN